MSEAPTERRDKGGTEEEADGSEPEDLLCPISQQMMTDPVISSAGHLYERQCIEKWLQSHHTDPATGAALDSLSLIPNHQSRLSSEAKKPSGSSWKGLMLADLPHYQKIRLI